MKNTIKFLACMILTLVSVSNLSAQVLAYASVGATIVTPLTISQAVAEKTTGALSESFVAAEITTPGTWASGVQTPISAYPEKSAKTSFVVSGPRDYIYSVTLQNHSLISNPEVDDAAISACTGALTETGTLVNGIQTIQVASVHGRPSSVAVVVNYN